MKIINVKKKNNPWKPDHGKYTMYSAWCDVEHEGKEYKGVKVCMFSDGIQEGELQGYEAKKENKEYQGNDYIQFTLKKEKQAYTGKGYAPRVTYTLEEFDALWTHAVKIAKTDSLVDVYFRCATVSGIKVEKKEPEKKIEKKPEPDVPFDPDAEDREFFKDGDDIVI